MIFTNTVVVNNKKYIQIMHFKEWFYAFIAIRHKKRKKCNIINKYIMKR